jgi:hypothetical protein
MNTLLPFRAAARKTGHKDRQNSPEKHILQKVILTEYTEKSSDKP